MRKNVKALCCIVVSILILALLFAVPSFAAAADGEKDMHAAIAALSDPDGETLGISHRGLWHEWPENSIEAIVAAAKTGIDMVEADIRCLGDGTLILFADETITRMLDTSSDKKISELTLEELSAMTLRSSSGGENSVATDIKVPTLKQALEFAKQENIALLLNTPYELFSEAAALIYDTGSEGIAAVFADGTQKQVLSELVQCENVPVYIAARQSNIIFNVLSFINAMDENGAAGVNLKTTNRYGVNFNQSVLEHFPGKLRAVANTSDAVTCGAREDTAKWWNDLISRGYSVIITDYPELFARYKNDCTQAAARLEKLYKECTEEWKLPNFKSNIFNDYKKAYNDSVNKAKALLSDKSSSLQDLYDCNYSLREAVDEINLHFSELENGTAGMTVSPVRILLCVVAAAAVILVQIYFFRKRAK